VVDDQFAAQALVVYPWRMSTLLRPFIGIAAAVVVVACTSVADPFTPLNVSGTVTQGGSPAAAHITLTAGGNSIGRDFLDGTYSISMGGGGLPESFCSQVRISADLLSPEDSVIDSQSRNIGACGDHIVDFEFP
jgi:hypothetical protein